MRMKVVTTVTSELVLLENGEFDTEHSVSIDDHDGLSVISRDLLVALLKGAMKSALAGIENHVPTIKATVEDEE